jgi:uncharacterized membrane protein
MRYPLIALTVVTVIAAFLRLYGLGDRCLWLDEALAWRLAQFDLGELLGRLSYPFEAENPPLYFALLHQWIRLFGEGELSLRLPAALAGVAAVPAMFLLVRELVRFGYTKEPAPIVGGWEGVAAATLLAVSELQVHGARQVRMYSLGALLLLLSSWALLRALRPGARLRWWWLYGGLAIAFLYTHNLAMFSVTAQGMFALSLLVTRRVRAADDVERWDATRRLGAFAVTVLGMGILFAPLAQVILARSSETAQHNSWMGRLTFGQAAGNGIEALISLDVAQRFQESMLALTLAIGAATVVVVSTLRRGWAGVFIALMIGVPIASMIAYSLRAGTSLFLPRYLTFVQVVWLAALPLAMPRRPRFLLIGGSVLVGIAWMGCILPSAFEMMKHEARPGMRDAAVFIQRRWRAGEIVVTQRIWTQLKADYYLRNWHRPREMAVIPSRQLHGTFYLWDDEVISPEALLREKVPGFWLVSSSSYGEKAGIGVPLPGQWRRTEVAVFSQDYPWEGTLLVEHYQRDGLGSGRP